MSDNIEYRVLRSGDAASYRQIRLECLKHFPDYFGTLYEDEINAVSLKFDKILSNENSVDFLLGAFDNDSLVGICGYTQEKRKKTKHNGEISQMYVRPDYGRKGIAARLLQLTMDKAFSDSGLQQIILGVVHTNYSAIDLYRKNGFMQYGVLENYFRQNDVYSSLIQMAITREVWARKRMG